MAQIPVGNFGYKSAEPVRSQNLDTRFESNAPRIAENLGRKTEQFTGEVKAVFDRKAAEEREIKELEAATGVMRYASQQKKLRSDLEQQYEAGEITWDQLDQKYQEGREKIEKPKADGLNPVFTERMNIQLENHDIESDDAWSSVSGRARQGAMRAATISAVDEIYKNNIENPEIVDQYLNSEEFNKKGHMAFGEEWPLRRTSMIEDAYSYSLTEKVIAAGDDVGALSAIKVQLESDQYASKLDPARRLNLIGNISSQIEVEKDKAERRALAAQVKAESAAKSTTERWAQHIEEGGTIPSAEIGSITDTVKGTSYEGVASSLVQNQEDIQKVLNARPEDREQFMLSMKASMIKNGSTPEQEDRYKRLESAIAKREKLEKEDPHYVYEMKTGENEITVDWQADTLQLALSERKMRADAMGSEVLLRPAEKRELVDNFNKANPTQQMQILEDLRGKLDPDMYTAVVSEIGSEKEQATLSYSGILAGQGNKEEAIRILKGAEIEKAGTSGYMSKSEFAKKLNSNFYSAFTGNELARENAVDMAYKRYLATGTAGAEEAANIDPNVHAEAIAGKFPIIGRRATIMPPDMAEEDFRDKIKLRFAESGVAGDYDDYEYTAVTDKKTGRLMYRVDLDGASISAKPVYLEVSR